MSDFDIVISLNPSQSVGGAAKVTEAVAKIETQSKDTQKALDAITLQTKEAQNALAAASEKATAKFKQYAAASSAAWGLIAEKTGLADTAIGKSISSATKLAAVGAQVAGPWGAAIGAVISLADDLNNALGLSFSKMGKIGEGLDEIEAHQREAGAAVAEATKAFEAQGKALVGLAQDMSPVNAAMRDLTSAFHGLSNAASSVPDWLIRGLGGDAWDPGKIKKQLDAINGGAAYIGGLGDLGRAGAGGAAGGGRDAGLFQSPPPPVERVYNNGVSPLSIESTPAHKAYMGLGERADTDPLEQYDLAKIAQDDLHDKIAANAEETLKLAANTRKWNEELLATNMTAKVVSDILNQAATSFADTLVDAANGADVSWREWGANMLVMMEKIIAQALILKAIGSTSGGAVGGGGAGLLGLLFGGAHATGGSYTAPATGGGVDSIPVMFRMSPKETATFTPHGQAFGGSTGGSGPINVQVVDQRSDRALAPSRADHQVFVELARQNQGFLRGLTR